MSQIMRYSVVLPIIRKTLDARPFQDISGDALHGWLTSSVTEVLIWHTIRRGSRTFNKKPVSLDQISTGIDIHGKPGIGE